MAKQKAGLLKGINEGSFTIPPDEMKETLELHTKAFFGQVYDYKSDNRTKNAIILTLGLCLMLLTGCFIYYVSVHSNVRVRIVDTSQAANVPFRILKFDNTVEGKEGILKYFFRNIAENLFSYDRNTIIENRQKVSHFLSSDRILSLEEDTKTLIKEYGKLGRFKKGNPQTYYRNAVFLDKTGSMKRIQVFANITFSDEDGRELDSAPYLITFDYQIVEPDSEKEVEENPLGIVVTGWTVAETSEKE